MKRLYEVNLTVYVMGENETDAHRAATDCEVEIPIEDCLILEVTGVPKSWENAIPYGGDDDKTCAEILNRRI